jgi:HD-GYP domain-containing protein (c-di-GMP phosphodiesterase class II)
MASIRQQPTDEERVARDVFTRLAAGTDEFEGYRHPHAERIAALSDALAKLFHMGRADRASLRIAALAHDLGEAAMKRDYIKRAGALGAEERLDLARHPVIGEQEAARAGADRAAQLAVRWSHEWWNGGGYPDALRGEQIPLAARILRVADSYCALTDDRPFRPAGTEDEARRHLAQWAGIEFDPRVVRAFLTLHGLPELRSYARREADADQTASQPVVVETHDDSPMRDAHATDQVATDETVATNDAASNNASSSDDTNAHGDDDGSHGGRVTEAGVSPYASTNDESATVAASNEVAAEVSSGVGESPRDDSRLS